MSRTLAREDAFKLIFEMTITNITSEEALSYMYSSADGKNEMWAQKSVSSANKKYMQEIISGVEDKREQLNGMIEPLLKGWTMNRISRVNLAVLLLAFYEIEFIDDIPYKVSANEAVSLAKKYGGEESGAFVNGVIGTFLDLKQTKES